MTSEAQQHGLIGDEGKRMENCYLQKFRLYETRSNFYIIGRDKNKTSWRVLKIERSETSELNIREDSTIYTKGECDELVKRIDEGNKATGGLKFVTNCYGIVGFVRFLGPYYMLIITKRKEIGAICGHTIYAITQSDLIALPYSTRPSDMTCSKYENRYKKLLCAVDLTKDFFFSYSYHVMHSLQKNLCDHEANQGLHETMFVWNEFLTREVRNNLKNTIWTVALVYGFFKQDKFSISGKDFYLTLIARRSRHFAGTRYLKRGVNKAGRVANDVETEQIVYEDVPEGCPTQISSIVQNRGSIPLYWSQETSRLNLRPDIVLLKDETYEATSLHFENLVKRYGNPIIVLNLVKTNEKRPRESILRVEFANAIDYINKDLSEENCLRFLHWDLHKHSKSNAADVLTKLRKAARRVLELTSLFYCQVTPPLEHEGCARKHYLGQNDGEAHSESTDSNTSEDCQQSDFSIEDEPADVCTSYVAKEPLVQRGVLRTNCIDCLDRTNVAQYAYGLVALGQQLHVLGLTDIAEIDRDGPLAHALMELYERMGDTLAFQYGGSAAHNKIFSERRGIWKPAIQSQEFFRTLQRYYSNAYMDAEKQDAINVFLGIFQTQPGKPATWELRCNISGCGQGYSDEELRTFFKRSFSDGNILGDETAPVSPSKGGSTGKHGFSSSGFPKGIAQGNPIKGLCVSTPAISTNEIDAAYSSDVSEHGYAEIQSSSNFIDVDWLSSDSSCEDEAHERSTLIDFLDEKQSQENVTNGIPSEKTPPQWKHRGHMVEEVAEVMQTYRSPNAGIYGKISDSFAQWVIYGQTLCN